LIVGFGLLALASIATVGCSPGGSPQEPTVLVKGKLTNAGKPLAVSAMKAQQKGARPMLSFIRAEESGKSGVSVPALTELDGSFEARVPKGKYRISVRHMYADPAEQKLLSKFDQRNSPILREITGDGQDLNIDLSKPQGP
jgi:hypothetical protein